MTGFVFIDIYVQRERELIINWFSDPSVTVESDLPHLEYG